MRGLSFSRVNPYRHLLAIPRGLRERHRGVTHVAVRPPVAKLGEYAGRVRLAGHRAPAAPGHEPKLRDADVVEERLRADVALREAAALGNELDDLGVEARRGVSKKMSEKSVDYTDGRRRTSALQARKTDRPTRSRSLHVLVRAVVRETNPSSRGSKDSSYRSF